MLDKCLKNRSVAMLLILCSFLHVRSVLF